MISEQRHKLTEDALKIRDEQLKATEIQRDNLMKTITELEDAHLKTITEMERKSLKTITELAVSTYKEKSELQQKLWEKENEEKLEDYMDEMVKGYKRVYWNKGYMTPKEKRAKERKEKGITTLPVPLYNHPVLGWVEYIG